MGEEKQKEKSASPEKYGNGLSRWSTLYISAFGKSRLFGGLSRGGTCWSRKIGGEEVTRGAGQT